MSDIGAQSLAGFLDKWGVGRGRYRRANSPWTGEDDFKLRELAAAGWPKHEIAEALSRTEDAIRGRASILGVQVTPTSCVAAPVPDCSAAIQIYRDKVCADMPITLRAIIATTADRHNLSVGDILSDGRNARLVAARHEAMWLCCRDTRWSLMKIAKAFNRDHTTVLHALRRQNALRGTNVRAELPEPLEAA